MKQLEMFNIADIVLGALHFEMPEAGYHCWYKTDEESGYCYLQDSNGPNDTFVAYDADKDKHIVIGREHITHLDILKGVYTNANA
tara:strand:- start:9340 stop:9594 length:255 start_codon:yes stop_codon:yes gene_type:complete